MALSYQSMEFESLKGLWLCRSGRLTLCFYLLFSNFFLFLLQLLHFAFMFCFNYGLFAKYLLPKLFGTFILGSLYLVVQLATTTFCATLMLLRE